MKIFISYRRADSATMTDRIYERLVAAFGEGNVFRDINKIGAGKDFRTVLHNATSECDVMLAIIGPQWANIKNSNGDFRLFNPNDFVRIEIETGLQRQETLVIPVLVLNAVMPSQDELPESLQEIVFRNAVTVRNDPDFSTDIQRLISGISQGTPQIDTQSFEPETVYSPQGKFWMGSPESDNIPEYETPQHEVALPSFRIGKYPVTNTQFEEYVQQTGVPVHPDLGWYGRRIPPGTERHPVTGVTWFEALEYCKWLKDKTNREYQLPNEAQWEKAARGNDNRIYPWGNDFEQGRCNQGNGQVAAVDAFLAQSPTGCFDLVGNIYQWTCSLWGENRFTPDDRYMYEWNPDDGRNNLYANRLIRRVVRGSTMLDDIEQARCSARSGQLPDDRGLPGARHGFRVAMLLSF